MGHTDIIWRVDEAKHDLDDYAALGEINLLTNESKMQMFRESSGNRIPPVDIYMLMLLLSSMQNPTYFVLCDSLLA